MGYDEEIARLRERINQIDAQLTTLFEDRMETTREVATVKQKYGKDVFDAKREDVVISRALSLLKNPDLREDTNSFFYTLMDLSKKNQKKTMRTPQACTSDFTQSPDLRVGYLGIPGSFSHIAAEESFDKGAALKNYDTFEAMFEGIKQGQIDCAILPAENTETGSITAVIDLLAKYGYYIVAEKLLKVSHSLLGLPGADIGDIKKVYSHPEPLAQCRRFLNAHPDITTCPALSTAQAAITVASLGDKSTGCIASAQAAHIYGLAVLAADIQNNDNNCTRFVVVARQPYQGGACNKTSIVFMVEHKPGSLCEILKILSDGGVNILKLESRPLKDRPFEYLFHIDFEGSVYDPDIAATVEKVKQKSVGYIYLGCYPRLIV